MGNYKESKTRYRGRKPVLIIEEDYDHILRYNDVLGKKYCLSFIQDHEFSLEFARFNRPCCIIMEISDGNDEFMWDVLRGLRGETDVPIIVITSSHRREEHEDMFEHGATEYITRPVDDEVLRVLVNKMVKSAIIRGGECM